MTPPPKPSTHATPPPTTSPPPDPTAALATPPEGLRDPHHELPSRYPTSGHPRKPGTCFSTRRAGLSRSADNVGMRPHRCALLDLARGGLVYCRAQSECRDSHRRQPVCSCITRGGSRILVRVDRASAGARISPTSVAFRAARVDPCTSPGLPTVQLRTVARPRAGPRLCACRSTVDSGEAPTQRGGREARREDDRRRRM